MTMPSAYHQFNCFHWVWFHCGNQFQVRTEYMQKGSPYTQRCETSFVEYSPQIHNTNSYIYRRCSVEWRGSKGSLVRCIYGTWLFKLNVKRPTQTTSRAGLAYDLHLLVKWFVGSFSIEFSLINSVCVQVC